MEDKEDKIQLVQMKLMEVLDFISNYLPLINCHSNDFLLNNHWETFLSEPIRSELDSLSAAELVSLLSQTHSIENVVLGEDPTQYPNPSSWNFQCEYLDKASSSGDKKWKIYTQDMQNFCPKWVHEDLKSFLQDAQRCSLHNSDILSNVDDLDINGDLTLKDSMFISTFMNQKKTHEVEVMGELCYRLSQKYDTNVVVDLGSGKGYLSTHLAFQHKLSVIGVDAQTINTKGASKRADILSRQWEGLTRNKVLRSQKTVPGKLGKKRKKELRKAEGWGDTFTANQGDIQKLSSARSAILDDALNGFSQFFEEQERSINEPSSHDNVLSNSPPSQNKDCCDSMKTKTENCEGEEQNAPDERLNEKSEGSENISLNIGGNFLERKNTAETSALKANHFPITTYIDTDSDLSEIVMQAMAGESLSSFMKDSCEHGDTVQQTKDSYLAESQVLWEGPTLMLTGLHTCGALGSNILRLFVNSPSVRVLCNVACCYHLMSEKFVASPFEDKEDLNEEPGFPLSEFLRKNRIGIGRQARNLASQSVNRRAQDPEVLAKQFPRMLLQKILYDQLGYVRSDWKGLRKLDQKSTDMFDYVMRAFIKLGLPTDKVNRDLVECYCEKYRDHRRKFAAFFQLKTALAPCIEAVIVLDRLCFLLEQECVYDAKLLQLFDPVTSPRCYGIVSVKT